MNDDVIQSILLANDQLQQENQNLKLRMVEVESCQSEKERILRARLQEMEAQNKDLGLQLSEAKPARLMEDASDNDDDSVISGASRFMDLCEEKCTIPISSAPPRHQSSFSVEMLRVQTQLQKWRGLSKLTPRSTKVEEKKNETAMLPPMCYYVCNRTHDCTKITCTATRNVKDFIRCDDATVAKIEDKKKEQYILYQIERHNYVFDHKTMIQENLETKHYRRMFYIPEIQEKKFAPFRLSLPAACDELDFRILSKTLASSIIDWDVFARMVTGHCDCFDPQKHQLFNKGYVLHRMWKVNNPALTSNFLCLQLSKTHTEQQLPRISFAFHGSGPASPIPLIEENIDPLLNRNEHSDKYLGHCAYFTTDLYGMLANYGHKHKGPLAELDCHPFLIPQTRVPDTDDKSQRITFLGVQIMEGTSYLAQINADSCKFRRPPRGFDSVVACEPHEGLTYYGIFNPNQINVCIVYQFRAP